MASVFKSLDKSDVRLTPFRAHKLWSGVISQSRFWPTSSTETPVFTLYKGDFYPSTQKWYFADNGFSGVYGGNVASASFIGPAQKPPFQAGDVVVIAQDPGYTNSSYEGQATVLNVFYTGSVWAVNVSKPSGSASPDNPGIMTKAVTLNPTLDQGNPWFDDVEPTTSNGKLLRVVHQSIDHLYYRSFYTNNKASFGSGNINRQYRRLEKEAWVISMPQSKFGEAILPGSVLINANYVLSPTMSLAQTQSLQIIDDEYGNLVISGSLITPFTSSGGTFNTVSGSVTKPLSGEWPFDSGYKYFNEGYVSFSSSFNRGNWQAASTAYKSIKFDYIQTGSALNPTYRIHGIVPFFTASLASSIRAELGVYNQSYNFENSDFSITANIMPQVVPTDSSGAVIITKQGPSDSLRIDENGNIYTVPASTRSPYRLLFTSESKVKFERDAVSAKISVTSSVIATNVMHHVAVVKTGSNINLYVNNLFAGSVADISSSLVSNQASIHIGSNYDNTQCFTGVIDKVKLYSQALTPTGSGEDIYILRHTQNRGNLIVGNVFYNHGMMVLSSPITPFIDVESVDARGTHTIWETEISCTVSPSEFNMTMNRTTTEYDPNYNQFVYRPFVTGSGFRPFVTMVGLYNDDLQLLAVGKLSQPIQLPTNTDTTFIVRFDR